MRAPLPNTPQEKWGIEDGATPKPLGEIIEEALAAAAAPGSPSPVAYSLEVFPPKTPAAFAKLRATLRSLRRTAPAFVDVTYAAGGGGGAARDATLAVCDYVQNVIRAPAVMHMTGRGEPVAAVQEAIDAATKNGIRNFLALRGDAPAMPGGGDMAHGIDVVRVLRKHASGESFGIAVAGYPEGHPESGSLEDCVDRVREKVDAGADAVVSQLFLDPQKFLAWKALCRERGITVPIIPGIIFINSHAGFERMVKLCGRVTVPEKITAELEAIRGADTATVQAYGVHLAARICKELYDNGERFFHFYTLNIDRCVVEMLNELKWTRPEPEALPAEETA
eukprot:m51a1_g10865 putative methylenetetrahydrofolate reductase (337) ;mRNA; r:34866-36169